MTLNNLGILQKTKNEIEKAEIAYEESLEIYRNLAVVNPQTYMSYVAMTLNNLGILQKNKKEIGKARKNYQETLEIYKNLAVDNPQNFLPYVARTLNNLANLYTIINKFAKAEEAYEEALKIRGNLAKMNPQIYSPQLAMTQINFGVFYQNSIKNKELSIKLIDSAITILIPFAEFPHFENYLNVAFSILKKWDIDMEAYLNQKLEAPD